MKKLFKKVAIVLSMALVFAAMPMSVFAEGEAVAYNPAAITTEAELKAAIAAGETSIKLGANIDVTAPVEISGTYDADNKIVERRNLTIDLAGKKLSASTVDTFSFGVLYVYGANLTINDSVGGGIVDGNANSDYAIALAAYDECTVTINGGTFTNTDVTPEYDYYELIYAARGGEVIINGGTFTCVTPIWTLNNYNGDPGSFVVKGGTFVGVNPAEVYTEPTQPTSFVADGYVSVKEDNNWIVKPASSVKDNVAADVPEATTHDHVWGYNVQYDAAAHWDYCHVCGAQNTPVAHSDADGNGVCDCGWIISTTPSRVNPNTGVTAEMLG